MEASGLEPTQIIALLDLYMIEDTERRVEIFDQVQSIDDEWLTRARTKEDSDGSGSKGRPSRPRR